MSQSDPSSQSHEIAEVSGEGKGLKLHPILKKQGPPKNLHSVSSKYSENPANSRSRSRTAREDRGDSREDGEGKEGENGEEGSRRSKGSRRKQGSRRSKGSKGSKGSDENSVSLVDMLNRNGKAERKEVEKIEIKMSSDAYDSEEDDDVDNEAKLKYYLNQRKKL
mmetsp:Transcript_36778/g.42294  ORF Transcript_36778/g.42294 Transcript_36778/m.42294 type:complete len:165 (-) Transcript_36778:2-496(-)